MRITEVNVFKACPPKETWVFVAVARMKLDGLGNNRQY